jgi:Spy/CpxP family protein refolding chaperone
MVKGMREKLSLTDEQADKVKAIIVKSQEHFMQVAQDTTLSMDEKRTRIIAAQKAGIDEIGTILTPEQSEKWKAELMKRQPAPSAPSPAAAPAPVVPPAEKKP